MIIIIFCFFPIIIFNLIFPLKYRRLIKDNCELCGLKKEIVSSLIFVESRYRYNAESNKGAVGLMQIMPSTAIAFKENMANVEELYDPIVNIEIGCRFLAYLYDKYQDDIMVLACYNAGEGVVLKWAGEDKKLSINEIKYDETYQYVKKVLRMRKVYKYRIYG